MSPLCSGCGDERPLANLTEVDGKLLCPEELYKRAMYDVSRQRPIPQEDTP